jgi:hypothetical protein
MIRISEKERRRKDVRLRDETYSKHGGCIPQSHGDLHVLTANANIEQNFGLKHAEGI